MKHTEDSRVKIPALLHLTRLGYEYLSIKQLDKEAIDKQTNIFPKIFTESLLKINPTATKSDLESLRRDISFDLQNEDLGKVFYQKLIDQSGIKLIDFENFDNNTFQVVTELPYNSGEDNFRPDIILLINGMPLVFIEVKKPNNKDGLHAERKRMNDDRFGKKIFRTFANITQFMIFSNNQKYEEHPGSALLGAFYASPSYYKHYFNYFREEEKFDLEQLLLPIEETTQNFILKDTNLTEIKTSPEFQTNKSPDTPTNRILTSLCQRKRLAFFLRYAIAYVEKNDPKVPEDRIQKHIMRYPQFFATKAIQKTIENGTKKGIIWHTQGSGKTALTYYNIRFLTDYFQQKRIIPKFYFIVDRLGLRNQAKDEFVARGLKVNIIGSRAVFRKDISASNVLQGNSGEPEINVLNIHNFEEGSTALQQSDYNVKVQRIYFLDEAHRSYNPKGSFLANLQESDPNAIMIGLTGTPLIGDQLKSKYLFGDYIHKYYYDLSIADGYTLRLMREEIATEYKMTLNDVLQQLEVLKGEFKRADFYADAVYVEPLLDYVVSNMLQKRTSFGDSSIGGMVICDSASQARMMKTIFDAKYAEQPKAEEENTLNLAAEEQISYVAKQKKDKQITTAALILHDEGDKNIRKQWITDFKEGKIDLLFVYNMLLTGFDAPRLKNLYIGRLIKKHNLLQALTRVNRTYGDYKYGFVIDFADIQQEFDATNQAYFEELQSEMGDELKNYSKIFKTREEIITDIEAIKDTLWDFSLENVEQFRLEIDNIQDKKQALEIRQALQEAKELYQQMRLSGNTDLADRLDFERIPKLYNEIDAHIQKLNKLALIASENPDGNMLQLALEDIVFQFREVKKEEMVLADTYKKHLRRTREKLASSIDPADPEFTTLYEELQRLFKHKNLQDITQENIKDNIEILEKIYAAAQKLHAQNERIANQYNGDEKFARVHKRFKGKKLAKSDRELHEKLYAIKEGIDHLLLHNTQNIHNEGFFKTEITRICYTAFGDAIPYEQYEWMTNLLTKEYYHNYNY